MELEAIPLKLVLFDLLTLCPLGIGTIVDLSQLSGT